MRAAQVDSRSVVSPKFSEVAEADQLFALLVPESEREGFKTSQQCDGLHALKQGIGIVASLQIVIGNTRAQMMDMVKADVAGEPLENPGQLVERTAFLRGLGIGPVFT